MRSVLKNKVLVSIIAILLVANIALLLFLISGMRKPDTEHSPDSRPGHSTIPFLQDKIGFNDQQINQFNQLKEQHRLRINPLFEDLRVTKDRYFTLVKDSPSKAYTDSLAAVIGEKQKNLDIQLLVTVREIRSLCNPEQLVKFDSLLPKIAYKMVGHIRRSNPSADSLKRAH
jgi:hypothetical protein